MDRPETRYSKTADGVHIAYQVIGEGPSDLVFVMNWVSNIDAMWEEPNLARFLTRLASFSRLILLDKRGVGLSDRVPDDRLPSLEVRMDDVRSVMDTAGSERAIVFGVSDGGPMAIVFAATHPDRTIALILYGAVGDFGRRDESDPFVAESDEYLDYIDQNWGTVEHAREEIRRWAAPSHADDDRLVTWFASYLRRAASPGAAISLARMNRQINAQHALSAVHVPTLVLAKTDDRVLPVERIRAMADSIVGARFVEFPGDNRFFWVGDHSAMLDEVERFVSEFRDEEAELQRFLATVLFTDIVGSTEKAAGPPHGRGRADRGQGRRDRRQHRCSRGGACGTIGDLGVPDREGSRRRLWHQLRGRRRARTERRARSLATVSGLGVDRSLVELLIDCEEDRILRAVLVGMLREDDRGR